MASNSRVAAISAAAVLALLVASAPAAGAPKRITGKLSKPGFTVIALASDGEARTVRVRRSRFRLRLPARRVTLHLRARNGLYAGPIVVRRAKRGRRAIVGVKAGAKLGKVKVNVRRGYAKARRLRTKWVDRRRWGRAEKGAPKGNGRNFGRVRSRPPPRRKRPPGDRDADGVADRLDIDIDGDRRLNNVDRSRSRRVRSSQTGGELPFDFIKHQMPLGIWETANANAAALSDADTDAALSTAGRVLIERLARDSGELDCGEPQARTDPTLGGLVYCTRGGTGRVFAPGIPDPADLPRFPECCDPNGNGFGSLDDPTLFLFHGATSAQIGSGDVLIQRLTDESGTSSVPSTLEFVAATVPALVSYDDGQGNSATIEYPVAGPPGPGGAQENPFPVRAAANGDVIVTMTFWRPQRKPIGPETGWIDIGGLTYGGGVFSDSGDSGCPQSAFSTTDPHLIETPEYRQLIGGGFSDTAPDRAANPANKLTFTVNLTRCAASGGMSFGRSETLGFALTASACGGDLCIFGRSSGPDDASQRFSFRRD